MDLAFGTPPDEVIAVPRAGIPARDRTSWLARHVVPYEPALRAWLRDRTTDAVEVDDIVLEMYAALAALPAVSHIDSPRAYVFATAQAILRRHILVAGGGETSLTTSSHDEAGARLPSTGGLPLRRAFSHIPALPAECREAFSLRQVEGLAHHDVAKRMGISEVAVQRLIGRALAALMSAVKTSGLPAQ